MKNIILRYYNYRLNKLTESLDNLIRYLCLYGFDDSFRLKGLDLDYRLEEFKLDLLKVFIPKGYINADKIR